jgi:prepilin-type N-terminal cleavage/methylation domain-containing protein
MRPFNCNQRTVDNQRGFTLLEILIAIFIFAIGMLAVATMQISGLQGNATASVHTGAVAWGKDRVEKLITRSYDHADLVGGAPPGVTHPTVTEGRYNISWTVTDDAPVNNIKTVVITVTWQDRGLNKSLVLNYYKADI